MKSIVFFSLFSTLLLWLGLQNIEAKSMQTVAYFDVKRYMGTWYEIGRFDHSFEKDLVGVTATYSLVGDNKIEVVNRGYRKSLEGKVSIAEGKAYMPDSTDPGKLKVSFFLWFYSDYYIFELDKDYQYALVGEKSGRYLWILSRTPEMEKEDLRRLLECATKRGYDTNKIIWVKQK